MTAILYKLESDLEYINTYPLIFFVHLFLATNIHPFDPNHTCTTLIWLTELIQPFSCLHFLVWTGSFFVDYNYRTKININVAMACTTLKRKS